ncbi:MAG: hypothetical protein FD168_1066 [Desulfobulbaceae bacterium]|nr:MAG: hypothetical protein FD168_1066 [Desulfobulbaceae bacterium]
MLIRILLILAFFAMLLVAVLFFAPGFLVHADKPVKADAVVLFSGPGQKHRLEEARRLMREGYAQVLIIPDFGIVSRAEENGALEPVAPELWRQDKQQKGLSLMSSYPRYFESTHVEALEAKRILDRLGLRSAIMVSSPYHTRRISMICNRVFRGGYEFSVVPARMQQAYSLRDWLDKEHRKKIVSEYVKMIWFLLYEPLSG